MQYGDKDMLSLRMVAGLGAALLVAACGSQATPASSGSGTPVDVSVSDCGSSWRPHAAGGQTLTLRNTGSRPGEVQLLGRGAHRRLVYAEVEPFGPGTSVTLHVRLAAGRYALACLMEDAAPVLGPTQTLTGAGRGVAGVRGITQSALVPATLRYTAWLRDHLPPLLHDTRTLRERVSVGDVPGARAAWVRAHLDYQRLGAAYSAFGRLGDAIDGLPQGLPQGSHDAAFTGFHRLEIDLWRVPGAARTRADSVALDRAVRRLPALVRDTRLDPLDLTLRAHEVAENALQYQLTGQDDFGSHTDLASVRAQLVGTEAVLDALHGPLSSHVPHTDRIRRTLSRSLAVVTRAAEEQSGRPVSRLPRTVRERLDATIGLLSERLAVIPATLEPRRVVAAETGGGS